MSLLPSDAFVLVSTCIRESRGLNCISPKQSIRVWPSLVLVPVSTVWHWVHFWEIILPFSTSPTFKLFLGHVWYKISRYKSHVHSLHNFLRFFFYVDHFNVFIKFVTILFCVLVFGSQGSEILASHPIEPGPSALESKGLTTGPPGKFQQLAKFTKTHRFIRLKWMKFIINYTSIKLVILKV